MYPRGQFDIETLQIRIGEAVEIQNQREEFECRSEGTQVMEKQEERWHQIQPGTPERPCHHARSSIEDSTLDFGHGQTQ